MRLVRDIYSFNNYRKRKNSNNYRMFRAIPTNNKLCFDKQLKRSWKIHQQKLRAIKSSISRRSPQHFGFLDQRAKRAALDDMRNYEIQKENHSLLSKIKTIGEKGSKNSYLKNLSASQKKRTLNQGYRKRELVKIVQENQDIIKRIQSKKSQYDVKKWLKERKQIQKNITLISTFPYKNYPTTQTKVNLWMTDQETTKKSKADYSLCKSRLQKSQLTFSGTHKIGDDYYLIETHLQNKIFTIEIENLQKMEEKYRLETSQKQAYELLEKNFDGQLKNLFNNLQINEVEGTCELKCFKREKAEQKFYITSQQ